MNILIMGDSWGKSEIEFCFLKRKHIVFNKSLPGATNFRILKDGKCFLEHIINFVKIDLIIWFQTEYARDINHFVRHYSGDLSLGYYTNLDQIHGHVYQLITDIRQLAPNAKWAIVGAQAPLYKSMDYMWADLLITDWKAEILEKELPFCHILRHNLGLIHKEKYDLTILHKELVKSDIILKSMSDRLDLFPDGSHPNKQKYDELCERILNNLF